MSNILEKTSQFRALHERSEGFIIPNPWDIGSAKVLEDLGFEALATTTAGFAFSVGKADGSTSREEVINNAGLIANAVSIPVNADLLNGFGDSPEEVAKTITLAGEAGLAGGSIEDTTGNPDAPLYDFNLAVERIEAAVEAARALDHPFVLTARCDGLFAGACELDYAIARIQAFEKAGADVLYIPGLGNLEQVKTVLNAVNTPVNVLSTIGDLNDATALINAGVQRVSVGSSLYTAVIDHLVNDAKKLKAGDAGFVDGVGTYMALQTKFSQ